jgi:iron complex outermembrane recepter protein
MVTSCVRAAAKRASMALLVPFAVLVATPNARAQGVAASTDGTELAEVLVTSTRRSADLQTVTATVLAVPAETLKAMNITSVLQLSDVTPGLVITPSGGNNVFMRGIGSASTGFNEAQVAVYVDGLFLPNPAMGIYSFNNIEQVEVLKGPQGTLYGRNATGGLIAVTTRDPGGDKRVDASVGYGNFNTSTLNLYASTPFTDTLAGNVAVFHSKQSKGWTLNVFTGNDVQKSEETGVQAKLVWRPTAATKITGNYIFDKNDRNIGYGYEEAPGTISADGTPFLGEYRMSSRVDPSAPFTSNSASLKIEHEFGFANFMSLTGYQQARQNVTFSAVGGPGKALAGQGSNVNIIYEHSLSWSQEFQLTSAPSAARLDWVAGAFIYRDSSQLRLDQITTCTGATAATCAPGFVPSRTTGYPTTKSYSAYGDATYKLRDTTRFTVGLRYTDETKGLSGQAAPLAGYPNSAAVLPATLVLFPGQPYTGNPSGIPTSLHFTKLTYRAVLAQDFGPNVHAYVSDNLGFKSGAFNANAFNNPPANPEELQAYEAGVKSELFNRRLRLNAAYFYYDYKDVQVRSLAPPALPGNAILINAAKERQKGIDIDLNLAVTRNFSVNASFEHLNSRYRDFPGTTCSTPGTRVVGGITVGAATVLSCNLAGYTTPNSPPNSGNVGFVYKVDTLHGAWTSSVNSRFTSRYPLPADASLAQEPHNLVSASVAWTSASKRFDALLWGRNLTGEYMYAVGQAAVANNYLVVPMSPRTWGLTLGYHLN